MVKTKRRADCCEVCHPSTLIVSHGSRTHFEAAAADVVFASIELSPSTASATAIRAPLRFESRSEYSVPCRAST